MKTLISTKWLGHYHLQAANRPKRTGDIFSNVPNVHAYVKLIIAEI